MDFQNFFVETLFAFRNRIIFFYKAYFLPFQMRYCIAYCCKYLWRKKFCNLIWSISQKWHIDNNELKCPCNEKMLFSFSLVSDFIFGKNAPCQLLRLNFKNKSDLLYPGARGFIFWVAKLQQRGARRASYSFYSVYSVLIIREQTSRVDLLMTISHLNCPSLYVPVELQWESWIEGEMTSCSYKFNLSMCERS